MLQVKVRPGAPAASDSGSPRQRHVFISYSSKDRAEVRQFVEFMNPLAESERLKIFFDADNLRAGDLWSNELKMALDSTVLFILFMSPASLASRYCMEEELLTALDRQRKGLCRVVPVVLKTCDWKRKLLPDKSGDSLGVYHVLPPDEVAVASREGEARDVLWLEVVKGLSGLLTDPAATNVAVKPALVTIPALLPYLCDQVISERGVLELLRRWQNRPVPLIVVLRAHAADCPDWFVNRIDERHLRKLLPRLTPGLGLQRHGGLQWPSPQLKLAEDQQFQGWFRDQLIERVLGDPYATEEQLVQCLRDEANNRLFVGGLPKAPREFLLRSLRALAACLAKLSQQLGNVRLAVVLWSEDSSLKVDEADFAADASGRDACLGLPEPLGVFGIKEIRDWAGLDEVRRFAAIDVVELDEAFDSTHSRLRMSEFVAVAGPLLQRHSSPS